MKVQQLGWIAAVGVLICLTALTDYLHPATSWPLLIFHASFAVSVGLVFVGNRSHAYTALTIMLFLGFWPKFMVRLVDPVPYLEPIGNFDGSTEAWNTALLASSAGVFGLIVARLTHLWLTARSAGTAGDVPIPSFYERRPAVVWITCGFIVASAHVWNAYAAVYATGVNPRVVLPFSLNVLLAWCYILLFPLAIAILVGWELQRRRTSTIGWLLIVPILAEAVINATSVLSRASYLLRISAYALATTRPGPYGQLRWPRPRVVLLGSLGAGFAFTLGAVMVLRGFIYFGPARPAEIPTIQAQAIEEAHTRPAPDQESLQPSPAPPPSTSTDASEKSLPALPGDSQASEATRPPRPGEASAAAPTASQGTNAPDVGGADIVAIASARPARPISAMIHEVQTLFIDRWTGLEGVLAVVSSDRTDFATLRAMVFEDPSRGLDSYYQQIARAQYEHSDRFTFLTLAGITGVLAAGGTWWVVAGGVALVTLLLIAAEGLTRWTTGNEMACAIVSVTSAFVTAQVTFPRLYAIFLVELSVTLGALVALRLWLRWSAGSAITRQPVET